MPKQLVEELIALNEQQSRNFLDADEAALRWRYRAQHPTEVSALKCMDGRINLPLITEIPMGVIQPYRSIGGIFDLGWPALSQRLVESVEYAIGKGRHNLFLVTYHFSKGEKHRGCRGHNYDIESSKVSARRLVEQIEEVFGKRHEQVYPVMIGIETDDEALVLHDAVNTRSFSVADHVDDSEEKTRNLLAAFYPDMSPRVLADLLPLVVGNASHVKKMRANTRPPIDLQHRERVLALGQGFDWLHRINYAFIVNDLDPHIEETISKAAGIIKDNRDSGRIPATGALLFSSVSYMRPGHHRNAAIARAKYLTKLGLEVIQKNHPDLIGFFHPVTAVVNWHTRALEIIEA
jgi:Carboxysome Shell Carbonic Anhydrase